MIYTQILHDQLSDTTAVKRIQDCTPIAEYAHGLRAIGDVGSKEMKHAASFPKVIVEQYCNARGITFEEFMCNTEHVKCLLADPALKAFRIWEGRA
jgi:hypothetical protein